jgi:hypothetical protein
MKVTGEMIKDKDKVFKEILQKEFIIKDNG